MSKIVIKEYDNTTAAAQQYANFSVVVPGFCGKDVIGSAVFDENGIYKCGSQAEFKENIGFTTKGQKAEKVAIACKLTAFENIAGQEYYIIPAGTVVYERFEVTDEAEKAAYPTGGYLRNTEGEGANKKYYKYGYKDAAGVYYAQPKFISDGNGKFFAETDLLYYCDTISGNDTLGQDAVAATVGHCGNQIAYELLGLGYEVLFKKMDDTTEYGEGKKKGIEALDVKEFWEPLKDRSLYTFRYLITGLFDSCKTANIRIAEIASFLNNITAESDNGRGDVIALLEIPMSSYSSAQTQSKNVSSIINCVNTDFEDTKVNQYSAIFAPAVTYVFTRDEEYDTGYENNRQFPAVFHYLACSANASKNYAEWYAVAGYTRGISAFTVASTAINLGDSASNLLQPRNISSTASVHRAVNIIAKIRNQFILWGNRTAYKLRELGQKNDDLVASDFLNIRQLCCTLKQQIYLACRQLTFDPNSNVLLINFKNKIRPILEKMKNDQGIEDYVIEKVETKTRALLSVNVRIVPIEAVEDFEIGINLEDSLEGVEITEG